MSSFLQQSGFYFGLTKGLVVPGERPVGESSDDDRARAEQAQQMQGGRYSEEHIRQQQAQQTGQ